MADNDRAKHGQPNQQGGQGNQKNQQDGDRQNHGGKLNKAPGNQGVQKGTDHQKQEKGVSQSKALELARAFLDIPSRFPSLSRGLSF